MKVIPFTGEKKIVIVPRYFPDVDDTLSIAIRNEMTNTTHYPFFDYTTTTNTIEFIFEDDEEVFKKNNKFVLTITDEDEVIYIGKLVCLDDISKDNIQNYKNAEILPTKIKF